jgi:hypothetical protein
MRDYMREYTLEYAGPAGITRKLDGGDNMIIWTSDPKWISDIHTTNIVN